MKYAKGQFHLILPGLLGPLPGPTNNTPNSPPLETLLSKADRTDHPGKDPESTLFTLFGVEKQQGQDWPSAAVSHHGTQPDNEKSWWLHADPVMLRPDMERLLLFPADALAVQPSEADELITLLNGHFKDDGWQLQAMAPDHWLLRLNDQPAITTSPLHEVAGRSMFPFLPKGDDALRWHGLVNEAQMLLYNAPVNQARREAGSLEINGLWLWGSGRLPEVKTDSWTQVLSDNPLARGLGRLAGASVRGLEGEFPHGEGDLLLCRDDLYPSVLMGDPMEWSERLQALTPWFEQLLDGLRRGHWTRLLLYPCNGHSYALSGAALRRFWRRKRPLQHFLTDGS